MYRIAKREAFGPVTFLWEVEAPQVARAARPGHFLMVRIDEHGERIPLTVADYDIERGTVTVVIQAVGKTTRQMMALPEGAQLLDFVGPLGVPSHVEKVRKVVAVGGGLGVAPVFPQLRAFRELGAKTLSVIGFRSQEHLFWKDRFQRFSDELHVTTNDGSHGRKGMVTEVLAELLAGHPDIDLVVAIGPLVMMRACAELTRKHGVRTLVSLNSIMVDGTGMCGSCRVSVDGDMKFACVDGPDFDGHKVDFDELMLRQKRFEREEKEALARYERETTAMAALGRPGTEAWPAVSLVSDHGNAGGCGHGGHHEVGKAATALPPEPALIPLPEPSSPVVKNIRNIRKTRMPMPEQPAVERATNFLEVNLGYGLDDAMCESDRCLFCKKPRCIPGCPVSIDIPAFIRAVSRRDIRTAYAVLKDSNALPAVCGRVCPQESQCEATCVVGKKLEPVAIGRLERFVADYAMSKGWSEEAVRAVPKVGKKVAVVGSGPAGLACAGDLIKRGIDVTIYEALHVAGGVLKYGIPEFRLPDRIIDIEVESLVRQGVKIELDAVIGKLFTIPQLMGEMGFDAVFIGTGAGSPKFMGIPGEALNGVFSANEFLTRVNLMRGFAQPLYDTPVGMGRKVAVVGAGNTAMDAARVAKRIGAEEVSIVYRRSERESPARVEELHHAKEEGVRFLWLHAPVGVKGSSEGWVSGFEVIECELGEPDSSGRRRPVPKAGSERVLDVDTVICALGTSSNPVIAQTTPGLRVNKWGYIEVDEKTGATSLPGVYAGGDIVTGAATVILAMGAGRRAADGILEHLGIAKSEAKKPGVQAADAATA